MGLIIFIFWIWALNNCMDFWAWTVLLNIGLRYLYWMLGLDIVIIIWFGLWAFILDSGFGCCYYYLIWAWTFVLYIGLVGFGYLYWFFGLGTHYYFMWALDICMEFWILGLNIYIRYWAWVIIIAFGLWTFALGLRHLIKIGWELDI